MLRVKDLNSVEYERYPYNWISHHFRAMGSNMAVWLEVGNRLLAGRAFTQVETLFEEYEQVFSRFRPDSELSRLNHNAGRWLEVSHLMWDVLEIALDMAAITSGRFDPTILTVLEAYGYTLSYDQLVGGATTISGPQERIYQADWTALELDPARRAVYLPPGAAIDLSGIVKGYTAQQAVNRLTRLGPCLVDAGGDLVAGSALSGYPGWPVAIAAPNAGGNLPQQDLCSLWLANQGLATSGIDYRTWEAGGYLAHHLIDPRSGAPAQTDALTVTILGDDIAQAEAWATASLVTGSADGMDALIDAGLTGLMVTLSGAVLVTPLMQQALHLQPAG